MRWKGSDDVNADPAFESRAETGREGGNGRNGRRGVGKRL
jgi:hypothetical protein